MERIEVSSSRSIVETIERWRREGLDGYNETAIPYLNYEDNSCPQGVAHLKID